MFEYSIIKSIFALSFEEGSKKGEELNNGPVAQLDRVPDYESGG